MKGNASVYDLRGMQLKNYSWFWSTSFYLLTEYIADGYDDDDLEYLYDTQNVLVELYSNIQVES
tara:strand:+ start:334 stop:525 length:192 start_codon:yes stop_codon:yes gene_type:complete